MKTGLIILDMLEDFVGGKLANPAARPIIEPIAELARHARRREDWVVIYANDAHRPGDVEFKVFGEHALAGSPGAQVVPELRPHEDDVVVPKRYYSAFTDTDLDSTCRATCAPSTVPSSEPPTGCSRRKPGESGGRACH